MRNERLGKKEPHRASSTNRNQSRRAILHAYDRLKRKKGARHVEIVHATDQPAGVTKRESLLARL